MVAKKAVKNLFGTKKKEDLPDKQPENKLGSKF